MFVDVVGRLEYVFSENILLMETLVGFALSLRCVTAADMHALMQDGKYFCILELDFPEGYRCAKEHPADREMA